MKMEKYSKRQTRKWKQEEHPTFYIENIQKNVLGRG